MSSQQRYVSEELTHFVGANFTDEISDMAGRQEEQYKLLCKILKEGRLGQNADLPETENLVASLGIDLSVPLSSNNVFKSLSVCFCDIPFEDLGIHMDKFSRFGLSFTKDFLVRKGASPVFYVEGNALSYPEKKYLKESYDKAFNAYLSIEARLKEIQKTQKGISAEELVQMQSDSKNLRPTELNSLLGLMRFMKWHMFSRLKFFESNLPDEHPDNFYMEREWRVLGFVPFLINDVHRIILPSAFESQFQEDFPTYQGHLTLVG